MNKFLERTPALNNYKLICARTCFPFSRSQFWSNRLFNMMCENQPDLFSVWISVCYFDSFKAKVSVSHSALAVKTLICLCTVGGLFYTLHSIPGLTLWFVLILHSSHKILWESSHWQKSLPDFITHFYQDNDLTSCQNKTCL